MRYIPNSQSRQIKTVVGNNVRGWQSAQRHWVLWQPRYPLLLPGPVALRPRLTTGLLEKYRTSVTFQSDKSSAKLSKFVTLSRKCTAVFEFCQMPQAALQQQC
jgi:hypothetical protein